LERTDDSPPKLYSTEELADILGKSVETIREFLKNGTIPAIKVGREWRVRAEVLAEYLIALETKGV